MTETNRLTSSNTDDRARLVALTADVGRALTTRDTLTDMLQGCAEALVSHLDAAFARVWVLDESENLLILRASAGLYTHLDGPHGRVPVGQFKIGLIAEEREPHLTNAVIGDPRVPDQEWARREGLVAFAGYPLLVGEQLVGVAALFARHPLRQEALEAIGSVADQLAVGIDRARTAVALQEANLRTTLILESIADAFFALDTQWRFTYINSQAEAVWGRRRAEMLGKNVWDEFPEAVGSTFDQQFHRAMEEQVTVPFEEFYPPLDAWLDVRAYPSSDGLSVFFQNVNERKKAEEERERVVAQQRAFLRDVLLSVTDGRLHLCHSPSDLPKSLPICGDPIPISKTGGIAELRWQARQAAVTCGFADERGHDLITAASEAAMNAAVHGGGGQGRVCGSADTIQVWVEDQGTGIDVACLPQATLEKGYSSAGTLGHGMKMMLQTADRVWLLTGPKGTTVVLKQDRLAPIAKWLRPEEP